MTTTPGSVIGGFDTHKDTHHAAVIAVTGQLLADRQFPATAAGHRSALEWMQSFGVVDAIGVEGTGSYGAGLARFLTAQGHRVVEVNRPVGWRGGWTASPIGSTPNRPPGRSSPPRTPCPRASRGRWK